MGTYITEEVIVERFSPLSSRILSAFREGGRNDQFVSSFAEIPQGLNEEEAGKWLREEYGRTRLRDIGVYEDGDELRLHFHSYNHDNRKGIALMSRSCPDSAMRYTYYDEDNDPITEIYELKNGKAEHLGNEEPCEYMFAPAAGDFREKYAAASREERKRNFNRLGCMEPGAMPHGYAGSLPELFDKIKIYRKESPRNGFFILSPLNEKALYSSADGEFYEMNDDTGGMDPIGKEDLFPSLPREKKEKKNWRRMTFFEIETLDISIAAGTPEFIEALKEKYGIWGPDRTRFEIRLGEENDVDMDGTVGWLLEESLEYPTDEIWLGCRVNGRWKGEKHIVNGKLTDLGFPMVWTTDIEAKSGTEIACCLSDIFEESAKLEKVFSKEGCSILGSDELYAEDGALRFRLTTNEYPPIRTFRDMTVFSDETIRLSIRMGSDIPLYSMVSLSGEIADIERMLSLDTLLCPAVPAFPEMLRKELQKNCGNIERTRDALLDEEAYMPVRNRVINTVDELIEQAGDLRESTGSPFDAMLISVKREKDPLREERKCTLFTPDHDEWFLFDEKGETAKIDLREFFRTF